MTPPLLIGAALLFWGWQTGFLLWGAIMAIVIEGARLVKVRWDLAPKDFYRIADASALLFLGMAIYRFVAGTASMARWLPFALFPLLAAQTVSTFGRVDLGAIFYTVRQREKKHLNAPRRGVDISYPCLALIVLASSAANVRTPAFFIGMALLAGWALWPHRPKRHPGMFTVLALLAALGGYLIGNGLHITQRHLEAWIEHQYPGPRSPLRNVTALGDIGRLKQYDRIVMRVQPLGAFRPGLLLHESSYNRFTANTWVATHTRFSPLTPRSGTKDTWDLSGQPESSDFNAEISFMTDDGGDVLSLPIGTVRIMALAVSGLTQSPYGAVRVHGAPRLVRYRTAYQPPMGIHQSAPGEDDLHIPPAEAASIERVLASLKVSGQNPSTIADAIQRHFTHQFTYSLVQDAPAGDRTPLAHFLEISRSGHCEFFATATVLMLRAAGIPARYASGYAAGEYSQLEKCLVVRARHAHAWALAHVAGRWVPVDTTPASWMTLESQQRPALAAVMDLFRWAGFQLAQWRLAARADGMKWQALWWAAPPLVFLAVWWARRKRAKRPQGRRSDDMSASTLPAHATIMQPLEQRLAEIGWPRPVWEPHGEWAARLAASGLSTEAAHRLYRLVGQYNRLRFHDDGLPESVLAAMKHDIGDLIKHLPPTGPHEAS